MANSIWTVVEDVVFLGVMMFPPTEEEWEFALTLYKQHRPRLTCGMIFSYEDGYASATQRKKLIDLAKEIGSVRTAIIADSIGVRAMSTALNWFIAEPDWKVFPIRDLQLAMQWLRLDQATTDALTEVMDSTRDELERGSKLPRREFG